MIDQQVQNGVRATLRTWFSRTADTNVPYVLQAFILRIQHSREPGDVHAIRQLERSVQLCDDYVVKVSAGSISGLKVRWLGKVAEDETLELGREINQIGHLSKRFG
jgi:hypothetical protein